MNNIILNYVHLQIKCDNKITDSPETLTSLVKALMDDMHPLTQDSIDCISINDVINDLKGIFQDIAFIFDFYNYLDA